MLRLPPLPALPRPAARPSFPLIAVIAPVVGAVVIGLVIRSPFVLVFALLSPLIAVATVLDGRRTARRDQRTEVARFDQECRAFEAAIVRAHVEERSLADAQHPLQPPVGVEPSALVRVGSGRARSAVATDSVLLPGDSVDEARLRELLDRAREHASLPVLVPRGPIVVIGTGIAADALARRLTLEPGVCVVRSSEETAPGAVELHVVSATRMEVIEPGGATRVANPEFTGHRHELAVRAQRAAEAATGPPASVGWSVVRDAVPVHAKSSAVAIGLDASGAVLLDLEREGPHALVGGTTGSGKSEFLRTLALALAADRSPSEVQLLFVDFKGGATFAGLTELPHAVGLVTDLDPIVAERVLLSLRAELRRRERVLVEAGARDLAQQPSLLARLIVLVDEFAALIDAFPELHAPFADISARGRSLGVHLVLCTQSPAGVVRDAVAANCAVRIAFRLTTAAGTGFLGAAGRDLAGAPPGRALVLTADGERSVQIATIDDADIDRVRRRWQRSPRAGSTWVPPLPDILGRPELEASLVDLDPPGEGLVFGLLDDPAQQRRLPAVWNPARDGSLAVLGAPRSGRSTALAAIAIAAEQSGRAAITVPGSVPQAWALLERLAEHPIEQGVLLADDLDVLVADADDLAPELLVRWDAAVRSQRRVGGAAIAAVGAASAARAVLGARFESRLLLRALDADDHTLAGAPRGLFDRSAPAGRGWWADRQAQVVDIGSGSVLRPTDCPAPEWSASAADDVVVVTRRPAAVTAALQTAHPGRVVLRDPAAVAVPIGLADAVELEPRILVADPDAWQSAFTVLSQMRRSAAVVVAFADPGDVRALLGHRGTPPPLDLAAGEVWVSEPGEPVRRRRWSALAGA